MEIREGAIDLLVFLYTLTISETEDYLTNSGSINWINTLKFFEKISNVEPNILSNRSYDEKKRNERNLKNEKNNHNNNINNNNNNNNNINSSLTIDVNNSVHPHLTKFNDPPNKSSSHLINSPPPPLSIVPSFENTSSSNIEIQSNSNDNIDNIDNVDNMKDLDNFDSNNIDFSELIDGNENSNPPNKENIKKEGNEEEEEEEILNMEEINDSIAEKIIPQLKEEEISFFDDIFDQKFEKKSFVTEDDVDQLILAARIESRKQKLEKHADSVRFGEHGWHTRYYQSKFKIDLSHSQLHDSLDPLVQQFYQISHSYLQGLEWVLKYYYTGCASWEW